MLMKKFLSILLTLTIAFFTLPFSGNTVLADSNKLLDDGNYKIDYTVQHDNVDVDKFFKKPAILKVEDGSQYVQLTHTAADYIKSVSVQNEDVKVINEDEKERTVEFNVSDLSKSMVVSLEMVYGMTHDTTLTFNLDSLKNEDGAQQDENSAEENGNVEDSDLNEEPKDEEETKDENENEIDSEDVANSEKEVENDKESGTHESDEATKPEQEANATAIDVSYIKDDSEETSSMASYLESPIYLEVKNGKILATITINDDETVTKLQVEGKDAIEKVVEGNKRHETFELDNLSSILNAYVEYQAPFQGSVFKGDADFRISLDKDALADFKAANNLGDSDEGNTDKDSDKTKDEPKSDKKDNNDKKGTDKKDNKGTKQEKKSDQLVPDKAYEINYTIMHEDGNKPSISDEFFKKPAKLFEKDGKTYLQMTIMNGDMISELSNKYGNAVDVEKNDDGSIVVQFRVNSDLSDMLLDMHVKVPAGAIPGFPGYDEDHAAILVFDKDSMTEVEVGGSLLVPSDNDNGPTVKGTENGDQLGSKGEDNDKTPKKPEFGSNDDNGTTGTNGNKAQNPQTGDTSGILLYTLLLLGSSLPLVAKIRRRFI